MKAGGYCCYYICAFIGKLLKNPATQSSKAETYARQAVMTRNPFLTIEEQEHELNVIESPVDRTIGAAKSDLRTILLLYVRVMNNEQTFENEQEWDAALVTILSFIKSCSPDNLKQLEDSWSPLGEEKKRLVDVDALLYRQSNYFSFIVTLIHRTLIFSFLFTLSMSSEKDSKQIPPSSKTEPEIQKGASKLTTLLPKSKRSYQIQKQHET